MSQKVQVYIEIEKGSNIKFEYDKEKNELVIDRLLPYPFYYPYAYGFIPNTLAMDGDDLDILIVTDKKIKNNTYHDVFIIGVLVMEDEKGMDEKVLCVLENDYETIKNITDLDETVLENIKSFFSNYKSKTPGKWSRVLGYENAERATELYVKSIIIKNNCICI
jgi:inorganic pyrophosphatase